MIEGTIFSLCSRSRDDELLSERTVNVQTVSIRVATDVSILPTNDTVDPSLVLPLLAGFQSEGIRFKEAIKGVIIS